MILLSSIILLFSGVHAFVPAPQQQWRLQQQNVERSFLDHRGCLTPIPFHQPYLSRPTHCDASTSGNDMVPIFSLQASVRRVQTSLDNMYSKSLKIKCPFWKRRATDSVDGLAMMVQFVLARHKSLPTLTLPGSQSMAVPGQPKLQDLSMSQIASIIEADWKGGKGYYITGRLTKEIYRDDCFFDGPDPDMPVVGLRKYIASTAQLFDHKVSRADIIGTLETNEGTRIITVRWRLEGILNLPWHPKLKPWTGSTTYHIDESGLIHKHMETWDISVLDAFASTLFPFLSIGAAPAAPISPDALGVDVRSPARDA